MEDRIFLTDENGTEFEARIILTFDYDGKNYVLLQDMEDDETVYAYTFDDEGNLYEVETEAELEYCEEVLDAFNAEQVDVDGRA